MQKKLSVVAILFVVLGFGMVHNPSAILERVSIILMGIGIIYLIYVLIATRPKKEQETEE